MNNQTLVDLLKTAKIEHLTQLGMSEDESLVTSAMLGLCRVPLECGASLRAIAACSGVEFRKTCGIVGSLEKRGFFAASKDAKGYTTHSLVPLAVKIAELLTETPDNEILDVISQLQVMRSETPDKFRTLAEIDRELDSAAAATSPKQHSYGNGVKF